MARMMWMEVKRSCKNDASRIREARLKRATYALIQYILDDKCSRYVTKRLQWSDCHSEFLYLTDPNC